MFTLLLLFLKSTMLKNLTRCPLSEDSFTATTPTEFDMSELPNKMSSNWVRLPGEACGIKINMSLDLKNGV